MDFASAIGAGSWAAAIKQLDAALASSPTPQAVPLLLNRGFCNLKLQLYRKALKVGRLLWGSGSPSHPALS